MTFLTNWGDFEKAAERLCVDNPSKVRCTLKYNDGKGLAEIKVTDDVKCLQYRTGLQQDLRKFDKFLLNYMRTMVKDF